MFRATCDPVSKHAKGFHITFPNGNTASVQWGTGNYCDPTLGVFQSPTAEVWWWDAKGNSSEDVRGRLTPLEVFEFLAWVANHVPE